MPHKFLRRKMSLDAGLGRLAQVYHFLYGRKKSDARPQFRSIGTPAIAQ
jgi:hypothetical protein